MNARRLIQIALLGIVAVTLVMVLRPRTEDSSVGTSAPGNEPPTGTTYVAYYFHGDVRCDTCRSIEAQAEAAVRDGFADELSNGVLTWQVVNTDRPENAHFIEDFQLTHSSVVVAEREGDTTQRFLALDRVWELVHDDDGEFQAYIQDGITHWMRSET